MFVRILTGIVLILITVVLLLTGVAAVGIITALFTVIGVNEIYGGAKKDGYRPLRFFSLLFAVPIILYTVNSEYNYFSICIYIISALILFITIIKNSGYSITDAFITAGSGIIISNMFYCILAVYKIGNGKTEAALLLILILIGACITDISAYFVGVTIGRHKLCPGISPKKSVEGSIGGILFVTLGMTLYGMLVLNKNIEAFKNVSIYSYIVLGLICGVVSQIGDLTASMVKRQFDIKDFGKILPGHGGIMDRFDSFVFVTPVIYFFVKEWIM